VHIEGSETIAEEAVEALDAVEPPSPEPILLLQKMDNRLVCRVRNSLHNCNRCASAVFGVESCWWVR